MKLLITAYLFILLLTACDSTNGKMPDSKCEANSATQLYELNFLEKPVINGYAHKIVKREFEGKFIDGEYIEANLIAKYEYMYSDSNHLLGHFSYFGVDSILWIGSEYKYDGLYPIRKITSTYSPSGKVINRRVTAKYIFKNEIIEVYSLADEDNYVLSEVIRFCKNRIINIKSYSSLSVLGENFDNQFDADFFYNTDNKIERKIIRATGAFTSTDTTKYYYDIKGGITKELMIRNTDPDDIGGFTNTFIYDSKSNWIKKVSVNITSGTILITHRDIFYSES